MTTVDPASDWAAHDGLGDAALAYLRDAEVALDAIGAVVEDGDIAAFTCERVTTQTAAGEALWQEVALTDGSRLILWHGDDEVDELSGEAMFTSSLRTIPLTSIVDQGLRTRYGHDADGQRYLHTVMLYLATQTPERSTTELSDNAGTSTTQFVETYRFSKSVLDGGAAQMSRLTQFALALSRATQSK